MYGRGGEDITIWGSQSSGFEGFCLLDRNTMQSVERQRRFGGTSHLRHLSRRCIRHGTGWKCVLFLVHEVADSTLQHKYFIVVMLRWSAEKRPVHFLEQRLHKNEVTSSFTAVARRMFALSRAAELYDMCESASVCTALIVWLHIDV
jgi:hypothetical protein